MLTLKKLTKDLNFENIDEVLAGNNISSSSSSSSSVGGCGGGVAIGVRTLDPVVASGPRR